MRYRKLKGYKYLLLDRYVHEGLLPFADMRVGNEFCNIERGFLYIRPGYAWDGPSGPTIDTDDFMAGSLVHDALYQLMREGLLDIRHRKYADELLRDICIAEGMPKWRAWYVYHSVRLFAKNSAVKANGRGRVVEMEVKSSKFKM